MLDGVSSSARPQPRFPHLGPVAAAAATAPRYDSAAEFAATGGAHCPDCGQRVRPVTLDELPDHDCRPVYGRSRRGTAWG
jgi:hypothetical protein